MFLESTHHSAPDLDRSWPRRPCGVVEEGDVVVQNVGRNGHPRRSGVDPTIDHIIEALIGAASPVPRLDKSKRSVPQRASE